MDNVMETIQHLKTPEYIIGYAESRIGGRSENQDSYGASDTPFGYLVTVCDGMGGGPGGKTASSIAVNEIIIGVKEGNTDDTVHNILIKAIRRANLAIIEKSQETPTLRGMGSTCTALLINEHSAIIAHVGDSRVYQIRGKSKIFRTFDHSMVFDLVKQKVITEEQARLSAQSNVITRALGLKPDIEVEICELPYLAGDRFLLSTDGIHGAIPESELILAAADKKHPLGAVTDTIATIVDGRGRDEGGNHDNLTLAIIETNINSIFKVKMDKRTKLIFASLMAFCLISVVFNCIQLKHRAISDSGEANIISAKVDSLDRVIGGLQGELYESRKAVEQSGAKELDIKNKVDELQSKISELNKNMKKLESQNKEYLDEIRRLIKDVEFCKSEANPDKVKERVKKIVIHQKYKEIK